MKINSNLDFRKVSKVLNILMQQETTTGINSALTALSQFGYDTTLLRMKIFDGEVARKVLQENDISTDVTMSSANNQTIPSTLSIKTYVDNKISGGLNFQGSFDASLNPDYPEAEKGHMYVISHSGKVGGENGEVVTAGDVMFANDNLSSGDQVTVGGSWTIIERNLDIATEEDAGIARIATSSDMNAGTNDSKFVTPLKLKNWTDNNNFTKKVVITQNLSVGSNTIEHGLGTTDIQVSVYETNSKVEMDVDIVNNNSITLTTNIAVSNVKIVVIG